jgi:RNA polymerase sigma-70 factor (ECF subfamily)
MTKKLNPNGDSRVRRSVSEIAQSGSDSATVSEPTPRSVAERRERDWIVKHAAGNRQAFAELVEAYRSPVYSYLVRSGVSAADRDDLFQEVFIRVHRAAGSYDPDRAVAPWLFTIAANAVRNHLRSRRVRELIFREAPAVEQPDSAELGDERIEAEQNRVWLEKEIQRLPRAQREALLLTYLKRMSRQQVAAVLGIPLNTLKTNVRRAKFELVRRLGKRDRPSTGRVKR